MNIEKQYIELYDQYHSLIDNHASPILNALREKAMSDFRETGFPSPNDEEYKHTNIPDLFAPDYGLNLNRLEIPVNPYEVFRCDVPNLSTLLYFIVNDSFYTKENPIFLLIYAQNLLLLKIFIYQQHKTLNNMMKKQYSHLVLFLSLCTLTACNDSKNEDSIDPDPLPPSITYHVEGYAELGAFDHNSTLTVFPLDKSLAHIEEQAYGGKVETDYGLFSASGNMKFQESLYFEVQVTGNFFNGTKGRRSEHKTTLRAINHVINHADEERSINRYIKLPATNVNIFTQLTAARICTLLKKAAGYNEMSHTITDIYRNASEQALKEVLTAFSISDIYVSMLSIDPTRASFSQYNAPASMMAAVSNILLTSVDEELLDTFFTEWDKDFAPDGRIDNEDIKESIRDGQQSLKYTNVYKQLDSFYKAYDFKSDFPEFWKFVDRNGDGILDKQDKPDDFEITEEELTPSQ